MLSDFFLRARSLFRRDAVEAELDEELRLHVEMEIEKQVEAGLSREEAMRRTRLLQGGIEQAKEECRDARGVGFAEALLQDVRLGLRLLGKAPGFTVAAVLTLALGIGASTAVFSLVNTILLKPLPYRDADKIVLPWHLPPAGVNVGFDLLPWGRVEFLYFLHQSKTFQSLGAFQADSFNLTGMGEPERLDGLRASAGFFPALGVSPELGRVFSAEEDQQGRGQEVVLGHQLWREKFGADRDIAGRTIFLNGEAYTVIGVMPASFTFPHAAEMPGAFTFPREVQLWVPLALSTGPFIPAEPEELAVVGRIKTGSTIQQAQAEMNLLGKDLEKQFHAKDWFASRVMPLAQQITGDTKRPLLLILAAVGVVLSIACSNVASLLLARSIARKREFTLRTALGAGQGRLARQLLTESVILAIAGGSLGILFATAAVRFVKMFGPSNIPRLSELNVDPRVFGFALLVTLASGILFGIAPALSATRANIAEELKQGGQRSGDNRVSPRIRKILLVSEVALALVLVVAAGLLSRTFVHLMSVDAGFNPEHVLTFEVSLPSLKYADQTHIVAVYQRMLQQLRGLPGTESVGVVETVPMGGATEGTGLRSPDYPVTDPRHAMFAGYIMASPGYLAAAGTPVLRGRDFAESDTADSQPVTIINMAMAKKYWQNVNPIGRQVGPGSPKYPLATIIGIVADVKHLSLRERSEPEMYVPYTQKVWPSLSTMDVVLRSKSNPAFLGASVREVVHDVDPDLPLAKVAPLVNLLDESVAQPKFSMLVLASFGVLAMVLASIGMYGVISYSVMQRTQEIGVRIALGASRRDVFAMVLGQGARLAGLGIAIGLMGALAATRMMASFLYGVRADDPATYVAVSVLLVSVAMFACYLPARRATRVDPMVALRNE